MTPTRLDASQVVQEAMNYVGKAEYEAHVGNTRLRVVEADITACGAEALVSSSDFRMVHDAGVSKAICLAGGKAPHAEGQAADSHAPWGGGMGGSSDPDHTRQYRIAQEVQRELQAQGRSAPLSTGTLLLTSSGSIPGARHVIHVVIPNWPRRAKFDSPEHAAACNSLVACMRSVMHAAIELRVKSLALPMLCTGMQGAPAHVVASLLLRVITEELGLLAQRQDKDAGLAGVLGDVLLVEAHQLAVLDAACAALAHHAAPSELASTHAFSSCRVQATLEQPEQAVAAGSSRPALEADGGSMLAAASAVVLPFPAVSALLSGLEAEALAADALAGPSRPDRANLSASSSAALAVSGLAAIAAARARARSAAAAAAGKTGPDSDAEWWGLSAPRLPTAIPVGAGAAGLTPLMAVPVTAAVPMAQAVSHVSSLRAGGATVASSSADLAEGLGLGLLGEVTNGPTCCSEDGNMILPSEAKDVAAQPPVTDTPAAIFSGAAATDEVVLDPLLLGIELQHRGRQLLRPGTPACSVQLRKDAPGRAQQGDVSPPGIQHKMHAGPAAGGRGAGGMAKGKDRKKKGVQKHAKPAASGPGALLVTTGAPLADPGSTPLAPDPGPTPTLSIPLAAPAPTPAPTPAHTALLVAAATPLPSLTPPGAVEPVTGMSQAPAPATAAELQDVATLAAESSVRQPFVAVPALGGFMPKVSWAAETEARSPAAVVVQPQTTPIRNMHVSGSGSSLTTMSARLGASLCAELRAGMAAMQQVLEGSHTGLHERLLEPHERGADEEQPGADEEQPGADMEQPGEHHRPHIQHAHTLPEARLPSTHVGVSSSMASSLLADTSCLMAVPSHDSGTSLVADSMSSLRMHGLGNRSDDSGWSGSTSKLGLGLVAAGAGLMAAAKAIKRKVSEGLGTKGSLAHSISASTADHSSSSRGGGVSVADHSQEGEASDVRDGSWHGAHYAAGQGADSFSQPGRAPSNGSVPVLVAAAGGGSAAVEGHAVGDLIRLTSEGPLSPLGAAQQQQQQPSWLDGAPGAVRSITGHPHAAAPQLDLLGDVPVASAQLLLQSIIQARTGDPAAAARRRKAQQRYQLPAEVDSSMIPTAASAPQAGGAQTFTAQPSDEMSSPSSPVSPPRRESPFSAEAAAAAIPVGARHVLPVSLHAMQLESSADAAMPNEAEPSAVDTPTRARIPANAAPCASAGRHVAVTAAHAAPRIAAALPSPTRASHKRTGSWASSLLPLVGGSLSSPPHTPGVTGAGLAGSPAESAAAALAAAGRQLADTFKRMSADLSGLGPLAADHTRSLAEGTKATAACASDALAAAVGPALRWLGAATAMAPSMSAGSSAGSGGLGVLEPLDLGGVSPETLAALALTDALDLQGITSPSGRSPLAPLQYNDTPSAHRLSALLPADTPAGLRARREVLSTALLALCGLQADKWGEVHVGRVQGLLAAGASVNALNEAGESALYVACRAGAPSVVQALLRAGVAVDKATPAGCTPLWVASREGHTRIVNMLLTVGAATNRTTQPCGRSPLWAAASCGHAEVVRSLVDSGASIDLAEKERGTTPLWVACRNGHDAAVHVLLEEGAAVDAKDKAGSTPLLVACREGHAGVVTALLAGGAALERRDAEGPSALHAACAGGHADVVAALMAAGATLDATGGCLLAACAGGHAEVVSLLLQQQPTPSLDVKDEAGCSPLHLAVAAGYEHVCTLLLVFGAALDAVDKAGYTPHELLQLKCPAHVRASLGEVLEAARAQQQHQLGTQQVTDLSSHGSSTDALILGPSLQQLQPQGSSTTGRLQAAALPAPLLRLPCSQPSLDLTAHLLELEAMSSHRGLQAAASLHGVSLSPTGEETWHHLTCLAPPLADTAAACSGAVLSGSGGSSVQGGSVHGMALGTPAGSRMCPGWVYVEACVQGIGTGGALCWLGLGPPRAPSRMGLTGGLLAHAYVVRGPDGLLVDRGYARRPGGLAHFRLEEGDTVGLFWDRARRSLSLTHNGKYKGTAFTDLPAYMDGEGLLVPVMGSAHATGLRFTAHLPAAWAHAQGDVESLLQGPRLHAHPSGDGRARASPGAAGGAAGVAADGSAIHGALCGLRKCPDALLIREQRMAEAEERGMHGAGSSGASLSLTPLAGSIAASVSSGALPSPGAVPGPGSVPLPARWRTWSWPCKRASLMPLHRAAACGACEEELVLAAQETRSMLAAQAGGQQGTRAGEAPARPAPVPSASTCASPFVRAAATTPLVPEEETAPVQQAAADSAPVPSPVMDTPPLAPRPRPKYVSPFMQPLPQAQDTALMSQEAGGTEQGGAQPAPTAPAGSSGNRGGGGLQGAGRTAYGDVVDVCDADGWTPLHFAGLYGHAHVVEWLLQQGAAPDMPTLHGSTPVSLTVHYCRPGIDPSPSTHPPAGSTRPVTPGCGWLGALRALSGAGAALGAADYRGRTLLMLASRSGHASAVKLLLELGADPAATDPCNCTAAMYCKRNPSISRMLHDAMAAQRAGPHLARLAQADSETHGHSGPAAPVLPELEILPHELQGLAHIGQGGFGRVYRALYTRTHTHVAVKEVLGESDAQGLRELRQEAALLRALHHSRIATCLGVVTRPLTHTRTTSPHAHAHGGGDHGSAGAGHAGGMLGVSLVMEYYPFSLHATMRSRERAARLLRPDVRARIAREIAEGLAYLHGLTPVVIHRDLKPDNILLDSHLHVKVADFGLSRVREHAQSRVASSRGAGCAAWLAPELLRSEPYNEKVDVYAYGVILYELATGLVPYAELELQAQILHQRLSGSLALQASIPPGTDPRVRDLILACMADNPADRPSFTQLLQQHLSGVTELVPPPPPAAV